MYAIEKRIEAINLALEVGVARAQQKLGFPDNPNTLRNWISKYQKDGEIKCTYGCGKNSKFYKARKNSIKLSDEEKYKIVEEFNSSNSSISDFAIEKNISIRLLSSCIKKYSNLINNLGNTMNKENSMNKNPEELLKEYREEIEKMRSDLKVLKAQLKIVRQKRFEAEKEVKKAKADVEEAKVELDIIKVASKLLKKEKGIDVSELSNEEKVIVINALRKKYKLQTLLIKLNMAKSSYFYQLKAISIDKYKQIRQKILEIFLNNRSVYGYRRIYGELKKKGKTVSSRVVLKIMNEENIHPYIPKMKKYSSYRGEISAEVPDLYQHNFCASKPYEKMVTDITEFSLKDGKVYLSPMVDLYDGCPVNWEIGVSPSKELTNTMLLKFNEIIPIESKPIIHSDRGFHYRIPDWISMMEKFGYNRSMSRKGCSADNSACEGFFGIIKREFFHNQNWTNTNSKEFIEKLNDYLFWFKNVRIKERLGFMSPSEYRAKVES